ARRARAADLPTEQAGGERARQRRQHDDQQDGFAYHSLVPFIFAGACLQATAKRRLFFRERARSYSSFNSSVSQFPPHSPCLDCGTATQESPGRSPIPPPPRSG